MSFQGDVRGIGLSELLQGLARGQKEGILTLTAKNAMRSTLGMDAGKIILLPDPDETPEIWSDRVRNAWAGDPNFRIDYLRMAEVARAQRLEYLYCLLDGEGVHFRFEPGPLPDPNAGPDNPNSSKQVYCEGIAVEFLLLEYARLADELGSLDTKIHVADDAVPCVLDPSAGTGALERLFKECNGNSTVQEIADRMGWSIRQCRLTVGDALLAGSLRLAQPEEILNLAHYELSRQNFKRAGSRLMAWCREGPPGPLTQPEAQALSNEWAAQRLQMALEGMTPRSIRVLFRRLDHALLDPSTTIDHWTEASRVIRGDRLTRLHRFACEYRDESNPDRPAIRELLDLAREFRDANEVRRSVPLLIMAAGLQPENRNLQVEVGQGLVAAGRVEEGTPWVIAGAIEMLKRGSSDRAILPLRQLLQVDPRNRECRHLLNRARRSSTQAKKLRKNLLIVLAVTVVLSVSATVKVHLDRERAENLSTVRNLMPSPGEALTALEKLFAGDDSKEIVELRSMIVKKQSAAEKAQREEWMELFHSAQAECTLGDPLVGLRKALELPAPPKLHLIKDRWPEVRDLFVRLGQYLSDELDKLEAPKENSTHQLRRERQLTQRIQELSSFLQEREDELTLDLAQFLETLDDLSLRMDARAEERARMIHERLSRENLEEQNMMMVKAREYADLGQFELSIQYYEELLKSDVDGKIAKVTELEIQEVQDKYAAVVEALRLASNGEHGQAYVVLSEAVDDPGMFLLPWRVESFPAGARVELEGGGFRTTPFELESAFGETLELTFRYEGFVTRTVKVEQPKDLLVYLSREPERSWKGDGRVDALPVAVGEDHVIVDRKGFITRIGTGGTVRWEAEVQTLSGIARSPVFLPRRAGHMLLVTEDGDAWIISAETGEQEGPWELGAPPVFGPAPNSTEVQVRLQDGRTARWKDRLRPTMLAPEDDTFLSTLNETYRFGAHSGLTVLRKRNAAANSLESPWNDWIVEIEDEAFFVFQKNKPSEGYTLTRSGSWEYLSWEAPHARLPQGRLWVSDDAGLRAIVP